MTSNILKSTLQKGIKKAHTKLAQHSTQHDAATPGFHCDIREHKRRQKIIYMQNKDFDRLQRRCCGCEYRSRTAVTGRTPSGDGGGDTLHSVHVTTLLSYNTCHESRVCWWHATLGHTLYTSLHHVSRVWWWHNSRRNPKLKSIEEGLIHIQSILMKKPC